MTQTQYSSPDLSNALEAAKMAFQRPKIKIDDVSNDIRKLEKDLNELGANDRFTFTVGVYPVKELVIPTEEPLVFIAPIIGHELIWQKHGDSWRLFFGVSWKSSQRLKVTEQTQWADYDDEEVLKKAFASDKLNAQSAPLIWPTGWVLTSKPLIDTKRDIRMIYHCTLPEFVAAFVKNWDAQKYQVDIHN